jgi:capsid protein
MKILGWQITKEKNQQPQPRQISRKAQSSADRTTVTENFLFAISYDGSKNLGESGPLIEYINDYAGLRLRSWQLFYESEIAQTIIKRNVTWKISKGLKLEAQPNEEVLQSEGYPASLEGIDDVIEYRWENFAKSKRSSYSSQVNLHNIAKEAYKNAIVGGDVLVILRYENGRVTVQIVDGANVKSPGLSSVHSKIVPDSTDGIRTVNGIESNEKGEHIAYWIQTGSMTYKRIEAKSASTGLQMAFMIYGLKYRIDNNRGMPLLSVVIETVKKIERYKEATVGSAEEAAKVAIAIEHENFSTGQNPFVDQLTKVINAGSATDVPTDMQGKALADTVAATTNKQAVNLPIGSKLTTLEHKAEVHFKDFYTTNANLICAAVGIPPEVAFMKYDSNFSASRAALKDWEHTILVDRDDFANQFYQTVYNFWLWTQVMTFKINLPGFIRTKL